MSRFCHKCQTDFTNKQCRVCLNSKRRAKFREDMQRKKEYSGVIYDKNDIPILRSFLIYTIQSIRRRCFNVKSKDYPRYGGRGITVCDRWLGPEGIDNFVADMGPTYRKNLTIDRIDVNGNYEPDNCKWSTVEEQANNKRNNKSHQENINEDDTIEYEDSVITLREFSKLTKIHLLVCKYRFAHRPEDVGWILSSNVAKRFYNYRGIYYNLHELHLISDLHVNTLSMRILTHGWSVQTAVETPVLSYSKILETKDQAPDDSIVYYHGETITLEKLSILEKMSLPCLKRRYLLSSDLDWLTGDDFHERTYEYKGKKYSLPELSIMSGLSESSVGARIRTLNWSVEKAVETPKRGTS